MTKRTYWTAFLLALVLLLTACGQKPSEDAPARNVTPSPVADAPAPEEEATPDAQTVDVENNGGWYVRVNGKTYFRKYGPDALEQTLIFGEFLTPYAATGGESEIMAYDLSTGDVESVFSDTGYGKLYFADGGFYLQERVYGDDFAVWYSLDGAECRTLCQGTILGVSDGGLLAVSNADGFFLYRNGEQVAYYLSQGEPLIFAGVSDDGLFLIRTEVDESGELIWRTLWQLQPDAADALFPLGALAETGPAYSTEPEQFLIGRDKIGVVVGYYAGTGHFLNDYELITATPGVEDSLSELDSPASNAEEGDFVAPKLTLDENGDIVAAANVHGDLEIGWKEGERGDLKLYDGFQWATLKQDFYDFQKDGSGYEKRVQSMEYLDGAAYVTLAIVYESPLDVFGWRDAFTLLDMAYLVIPASQGVERELDCVDHHATLQGNVWFTEDEASVLWQQTALDGNAANYVYQIPIARDAEWDNRASILSDAVHMDPDEYAYQVPDEQGQFLCLRLNRDGEIVFLTETSPDALLSIQIGVDPSELSGASETLDISPRPSDEDTPWYWAKLTALQDGVTIRMERVAEQQTAVSERAREENRFFIPDETLLDRGFRRGEYVMARVSLPWYPELRVSVLKDGTWGAYVFGEDNFEREEPVDGRFPEMILAGYPIDEEDAPTGFWMYRDPLTKEYPAALSLDGTGPANVETAEQGYWLSWRMDRLYSQAWQEPDLLCLSAEEAETIAALNGMEGSVGDYRVERFHTDGETILHLVQANNGDAALDMLIPSQSQWNWEFTFHRYEGVAEPAAPVRNAILTAEIVKVDRDRNAVWMQGAEVIDEREDGTPVYRVDPYKPCVLCWLDNDAMLAAFEDCADADYPMKVYEVEVNRDGMITSLTEM